MASSTCKVGGKKHRTAYRKHKRSMRRMKKRTVRRHKRGGSMVASALGVVKKAFLPFLMYLGQKKAQRDAVKRRRTHKNKKQ